MPPTSNKNAIAIGASGSTSSNIDPWWSGIALTPNRDRQGLLPTINTDGKLLF